MRGPQDQVQRASGPVERIVVAYSIGRFSPAERQREKQVSRERDAARLQSGQISRGDLRLENGFFNSLAVGEARIINRRARHAQRMASADA